MRLPHTVLFATSVLGSTPEELATPTREAYRVTDRLVKAIGM